MLFLGLLNKKANCSQQMEGQSDNIQFKRLCGSSHGPIYGTTLVHVWIDSQKPLKIPIRAHDMRRNAKIMNDNLVAGEGKQERI
jgi:hypothetical protein